MNRKITLLMVLTFLIGGFANAQVEKEYINEAFGVCPTPVSIISERPTVKQNINTKSPITAFAWNAYHTGGEGVTGKGPVNIVLPTGTMTQIAVDESDFIAAADYVGDVIYGTRYGSYPLVKINPATGVVTEIGGGAPDLTGFAYDVTTETAYVINFSGVLGKIDLETGAVTTVGGNYPETIALACNSQGELFAISLEDHIAKIDKTTGAHTIIGNLGIDIHYAQDICFDRDNNVLYGTLYEYSEGGGLFTIDTTTGAATLLADIVDELVGFAIPYTDNGGNETYSVPYSEDFSNGWGAWTIVGEGADCWSVQNHNYAGGTAPEMTLEWIEGLEFDGNSYCMSPAIDTQGFTSLQLEFKHAYDIYETGASIGLYSTIDDGVTWEELWTLTPSEDIVEVKNFTIDNAHVGNSNFRLGFMFSGSVYAIWDWAIDDILLVDPEPYDLGVIDIDVPSIVEGGTTITPKVTVKNFGINDVSTWSVTLTDGDAYTSTVSNINILSGETKIIEMDNWTPDNGSYTLTASINFAQDGLADNNTISKDVTVLDVIKAFAWDAYTQGAPGVIGTGPINIDIPTGNISQIAVDEGDFIASADYVGDAIYGTRYSESGTYPLVKIDPITGVVTTIGGGGSELTGFAYDVTTETAYVMDINGVLGTIDLETGVVTTIGGSYEWAVALACDSQGNLYAISIDSDDLVKINKQTGEATVIGVLGMDINYIQDICFDRDNNILYGTLYEIINGGGLYTIDVTTGEANLLVNVMDDLSAFAIPYTSSTGIDNESCEKLASVYPNPSDGIVNVNVTEKSVVTVVDLSGRVVASYNVGANETLSFSQTSGIYLVKVKSDGRVSTHKLIIK